ncbi:Hypothetical protein NTJ_15845 [Nesidiocoris tenuis]|uniref:Uncharacterized protein n=1 Tax=Nesidiocoris tenuis TaxID=355587 RepID=A0ABN7BFA8_9HEMI|nr:Hypothetical protein NTJ_15845 [Nesidiocoris tenuis]
MCEPVKVAGSLAIIAGSAYHFYAKYANVEVEETDAAAGEEEAEDVVCVIEGKKPPIEKEEVVDYSEDKCRELEKRQNKRIAELRKERDRNMRDSANQKEKEAH